MGNNTSGGGTLVRAISSRFIRPPDHKSWFGRMPDEMIHEALEFLTASDLCTLAQVSRRFRDLSDYPKVWSRILFKAYPGLAPRTPPLQLLGFNIGSSPRKLYLEERWRRLRTTRATYNEQLSRYRRKKCTYPIEVMDAPLAPVLAAIITVTTIALIFASLHQTGAVQLWAMLPMFGWFAFIFLMCCCVISASRDWFCFVNPGRDEGVFFTINDASNGCAKATQPPVWCCLLGLPMTWAILLTLRSSGYIDTPYIDCFIPLWIFFGCFCCIPCFPIVIKSHTNFGEVISMCTGFWVGVMTPIVITMGLLAWKVASPDAWLDGGGPIRMALVLIPIWIVNALFFCAATGAAIGGNGYGCLAWCCCIGPILAFEILFCAYADKGGFSNIPGGNHAAVNLASVFAPLFVWAAICLASMIALCVSVWDNDRHSCRERCWDSYDRPHEPLMENIP